MSEPMRRPEPHLGLHHLALNVSDLAAAEHFYVELLGFAVEWRPDADNLYLNSGADNLALHRVDTADYSGAQRLDHLGLIVGSMAAVDQWHTFLAAHQIKMTAAPRTHRDGARSFYCLDPDGNSVQIIYHPPLAGIAYCNVESAIQ